MSDTSQGPGWWLASDGKWYPPELWTGPPGSGPPAQPGSVAPGPDPLSSPAQPNPYAGQATPYAGPSPTYLGQPPGTVGAPYGSPYPGQPYGQYPPYANPAGARNNGLAVASLVCACLGWFLFVPSVLAVIFGFVARSQIRQSAGTQRGEGLALAGIIVGFAWIVLFVILIAVRAAHNDNSDIIMFGF